MVNPKYKELDGVACYPSVSEIPDQFDCVLVAVSEKHVLPMLEECADKRIGAAVVFSSGFAEMGSAGKEAQNRIKELARTRNLRVCGPNCIGVANFNDRTVLSFSQLFEAERLMPGNIGFISQSGALGGSLVNRASQK